MHVHGASPCILAVGLFVSFTTDSPAGDTESRRARRSSKRKGVEISGFGLDLRTIKRPVRDEETVFRPALKLFPIREALLLPLFRYLFSLGLCDEDFVCTYTGILGCTICKLQIDRFLLPLVLDLFYDAEFWWSTLKRLHPGMSAFRFKFVTSVTCILFFYYHDDIQPFRSPRAGGSCYRHPRRSRRPDHVHLPSYTHSSIEFEVGREQAT